MRKNTPFQCAFPNQGSPFSKDKLLLLASGPTEMSEAELSGEGFFPTQEPLSATQELF